MLLQQGYRMNIQITTGLKPFSDVIFHLEQIQKREY